VKARRLLDHPAAVTSGGSIVINLAHVEDVTSVEEIVELLKSTKLTGKLFVGIALDSQATRKALTMIDDSCAEIVAVSKLGRTGKRQL
jgi:hypothetical protein